MRPYVEVARRSFRRWSTYRAATAAGVVTNTVFGILLASVMVAVFRTRDEIGGLDVVDAVTFRFLGQGLLAAMAVFMWTEIADRVRTGDVVTDLCRPVDFQLWWLAQDLGRAAFQAPARGLAPVLVGAALFELRVTTDPVHWVAFAVATVLAVTVSFGLRFLVNLSAFWVLDARGPIQLLMAAWAFLAGFFLPVQFFPAWLETLARSLPFVAVVQIPVEIALGRHDGAGLAGVLAVQAAWAAALLLAGRAVLAAATRKLVVQGG